MKKFYFCLVLSLLFSFFISAQIPNNDFEQWSGDDPLYWHTSNHPEVSPGAINIIQTSDSYSGSFAVKGEVTTTVDINGGTFTFYPSLGGNYFDGFAITKRPKELKGYFLFKPVGASAYLDISVTLTRWSGDRVGIGYGGKTITNTIFLDSTYSEFVVPINYLFPDIPDTIHIGIGIGGGEPGSIFYVDSLSLSFFQIIKPAEDEIVISGEKNIIAWDVGSGNINISYSLDGGSTFQQIINDYPADSGKYIWDVPKDLLSRKGIIRIEDSGDNTQFDEQPVKFKPWQLTRKDANDNFELFEPDQDGWSFSNTSPPMWPMSWWQQFNDYRGIMDTIAGKNYPKLDANYPFILAKSSDFPDWPLFVDVFGVSQCYRGTTYNSRATTLWQNIAINLDSSDRGWHGACVGFAVSSLLGFYWTHSFPKTGNFGSELFGVPFTSDIGYTADYYFVTQFGTDFQLYKKTHRNTTVRQLLAELKDMFGEENDDGRPLNIAILRNANNQTQVKKYFHEVTPYKLERIGETSQFSLKFYDSFYPGSSDRNIIIDSVKNTWTDTGDRNYGTNRSSGLYLGRNSANFLSPPALLKPNFPNISKNNVNPEDLTIFNTSGANITITSDTGDQIGYSDSVAFKDTSNFMAIIPITGNFHSPIGYDLPIGKYSVQLKNFTTSSSYASFMTDSTIYNYRRSDANENETDNLNFSNGIQIENSDASLKNINVETIIDENTSEKDFEADNMQISQNDSIHVQEINRKDLLLKNYGAAKNYDLRARSASGEGEEIFLHSQINLASNSSHKIIPEWESLETSPVKILIDNGNDGTIDDSIFVSNEVTEVKDRYSSAIPEDYKLYPNYPNPFNPTTTIKFDLPTQSHITLKVYNILGQEVATLVNAVRQAGSYSIVFSASALPSGVYVFTLATDEFISTKKMIVIK